MKTWEWGVILPIVIIAFIYLIYIIKKALKKHLKCETCDSCFQKESCLKIQQKRKENA